MGKGLRVGGPVAKGGAGVGEGRLGGAGVAAGGWKGGGW